MGIWICYYHMPLSFINESPKLCQNVRHITISHIFWQNDKKWFHQIISLNQVDMIGKNSTVRSILVQTLSSVPFFLTLTTKFWHFLWLSICTHPHIGSSIIQYHLYISALFISPKRIVYSLLEYKRYTDIYNHKNLKKLKKPKK